MIIDLPLNISHPNSVWEAQEVIPQDYIMQMKSDSKRAERFTRMLYELHHSLGRKIAERLDLTDIEKLMDLGGGSGVISLALLERYPDLKVVVVDIENVCVVGREIAGKTQVANRITYFTADFIQDDLPSGFDMILECDVGVYSEALFRKLWTSLKDGGRFVIITNTNEQGAWVTHKESKPSFFWYLNVFSESLGGPKYKLISLSDVKSQLHNAGFQNVSDQVLEDGIVLIQAIK
jgi:ubiquinone/menaquinone biosynthesis C-methylase UbiE